MESRTMIVIDDFLPEFDELQKYAKNATFTDVVNSFDGVTYPLICADIPDHLRLSIITMIDDHFAMPEDLTMFMRRSPAGVHCPHQVHSDASMGTHSLMLYLNAEDDCRGGTSFLSHKLTGISYNPELPEAVEIIVADQNRPDAWNVRDMANMIPNRAVIFDSDRLHRAEPVGGFGDTPENARVVLTCFFRRAE
jgi:hypothetical protein